MRPLASPLIIALGLIAATAGCSPKDQPPDPGGTYPELLPLTQILPPDTAPPPSPAAALEAEAAALRARAEALRNASGG